MTSIQHIAKERDLFDFGHKTQHMGTKPKCYAPFLPLSGVALLHTNMIVTITRNIGYHDLRAMQPFCH